MPTKWLTLMCLVGLPTLAPAQEKPLVPFAAPPRVVMARAALKDGKVELLLTVPQQVPEVRERFVIRDGMKVKEQYTVFVNVVVDYSRIADGKQVIVTRKDGKKVDAKELPKLLEKRTAVVLFDQSEFDAYYLQVVDERVLVITLLPKDNVPPPEN